MFPSFLALALAGAPEKLDVFANKGPVPIVKVTVDKANLQKLNQNPRGYIHAALAIGDEKWPDIGLHIKGAAGSTRDWNDKPGLTLNADKWKADQLFFEMDKFHLNNSVQDGTYLNEPMLYAIAREAGLPSPRTAHVLVELNGRKVGLYVLKEGYDGAFLKRHFKDASGNLYDGGFLQDIDAGIRLDRGPGGEGADLKALSAAARIPDHKKRMEELGKKLDIDKFVTLWALEVLACDWDGYARTRNNYRLYHDPKTDQFVMIIHGKDQLFQNTHDGLIHGWQGLLARRLYETEEGKKKYHAALKKLGEEYFTTAKLHARADALAPRVRDALNAVQKGAGDNYMRGEFQAYKDRLKQRGDYLKAELPKLK